MYTPRATAQEAIKDVRRVADDRVEVLKKTGAHAVWAESEGTSPSIRLDIRHDNGTQWVEFIETSCTRGVHAFDIEYLNALREDGWVVLHYPVSQINEEFARLKAEELLGLALASGMDRAEVWVYLYDRDGNEVRVA